MMPRRLLVSSGIAAAISWTAMTPHLLRADGARRQRIAYGDHPSQFGELFLPESGTALPVVVVIHGGFWHQRYGLDLATPLALDLVKAGGVAVWNVEYRRLGGGGGWPATFADIVAAVDALADRVQRQAAGRLDLERIVAVGHSAGGHLAAWLASMMKFREKGKTGQTPRVALIGAVSQAGVLDLDRAVAEGIGGGSVEALLGGKPLDVPRRYRAASPIGLLPAKLPIFCVHGDKDAIVPYRQSEGYVARARELGDRAILARIEGAGHFDLIDPEHPAWDIAKDMISAILGR